MATDKDRIETHLDSVRTCFSTDEREIVDDVFGYLLRDDWHLAPPPQGPAGTRSGVGGTEVDLVAELIEASYRVSQNFEIDDNGRYIVPEPWFTNLGLATAALHPEGYTVVHLGDDDDDTDASLGLAGDREGMTG